MMIILGLRGMYVPHACELYLLPPSPLPSLTCSDYFKLLQELLPIPLLILPLLKSSGCSESYFIHGHFHTLLFPPSSIANGFALSWIDPDTVVLTER